MQNSIRESRSFTAQFLLASGAIGSLLFIVVFLIEGATRAGYSPFRHPVSSLSIGDQGWTQVSNFIVAGSLIVLFAVGLWRDLRQQLGRWIPPLLGLVGIGLIGAGLFTTDPAYGYPTDMPLLLAQVTTRGHLHDLFSVLVFLGLPASCFIASRRFAKQGKRGWSFYSLLSGIVMLVAFVLAAMGFSQTPGFVEYGGLFQRLSLISGLGWIALLSLNFFLQSGMR